MGKYILILTFSLAFAVTVIASQAVRTESDTSEDQAQRQETVLAREIAQSAFQMGMAELRRDFQNWRVDRTEVSYENGSFDLTSTGPASGTVTLTAVGRLGDAEYEVTGKVKQVTKVSSLFNGITAAGEVDLSVSGPGCSGEPCVSGVDAGDGENRRGISLPNPYVAGEEEDDDDSDEDISDTVEDVCTEFDDQVEGRGDGCDVKGRTEGADDWVQDEMETLEQEIDDMIENDHEDVTVCGDEQNDDDCDVRGASSESGVLYVTGDMEIRGNAQWNGPVYVDEEGSVEINGGGNTNNINGGLLMEEDAEFEMNGGNRVQYNSDKVMDFVNPLPSVSTEVVEVTERKGTLLSATE